VPVSVLDQFADLERSLADRHVRLWIASLSRRGDRQRAPRWDELSAGGTLFPTALAVVRACRSGIPDAP